MPTKQLFLLSVLCLLGVLPSCTGPQKEYEKEVRSVDSLLILVDSAAQRFHHIEHEAVLKALADMKEDMRLVQFLSPSEMTRMDATLFASYNSAKRLVKDYPQRHDRIAQEIDRTCSQLTKFREALSIKGSKDVQGNLINQEYVKKNYEIEARVASSLILEIDETIGYVERGMKKYRELADSIDTRIEELRASQ